MSRAYTREEVREKFLNAVRDMANYWAKQITSKEDVANGVAFSILGIMDGCNLEIPPMDLVVRSNASDKEYSIKNGENWYEDGMVINGDVSLHDIYYTRSDDYYENILLNATAFINENLKECCGNILTLENEGVLGDCALRKAESILKELSKEKALSVAVSITKTIALKTITK